MTNTRLPLQAQSFTLAGSGVAVAAANIILKSFKDIDGTNIAMSDLGTKAYLTLEPNNGTREEQVSFTGVTQNSDGTATLSGVKNVAFKSPYTETSGVSKAHAGGSIAVLTNTSGFYSDFANKENDETINGAWEFTDTVVGVTPTLTAELATKGYVDGIAVSGAPDASTSVKGITKLATAPVSAADPIAVGDNDPRLPTTDEKDALAGTEGTPSSTNLFVTNDDTSATSSADKLVRADATGKIDPSFYSEYLTVTSTLGETASAGTPVYTTAYPTNAVTYDLNATYYTASSSSFSSSFTVGNNSNRILFAAVCVNAFSGATISSVTYNGVAMTELNTQSGSPYTNKTYYLLAPTTGSNNITVTTSLATAIGVAAFSVYNAKQQAPEASSSASTVSPSDAITATVTPKTNRAMVISVATPLRTSTPTGTAYTTNPVVVSPSNDITVGSSGELTPMQPVSISATGNGTNGMSLFAYSFAPVAAGTASRVYKTRAAQVETCKGFIGLLAEGGVSGDTINVAVVGADANQTGMTAGSIHYLGDTAGTLSTTAGTIKVKAGIARSDTELIIQPQIADSSL